MSSPAPSIAELRAVAQPESVIGRNSAEHWGGRLYMRRLSPYVTRLLLRTPLSANAITWLMIPAGIAGSLALTIPGLWGAILCVVLIQLQLLLDCCDGEVARWRRQFSPAGVYLDRLAHFVTETALPIALGIRADGGWDELGGYTTLGLLAAVLALLVRMEIVLVHVARAEAGRPPFEDTAAASAPRVSGLRRLRSALGLFPFFRAFVAIEATLLALAAALLDLALGDLEATRALVIALVPVAAVTALGRLFAILSSERLR